MSTLKVSSCLYMFLALVASSICRCQSKPQATTLYKGGYSSALQAVLRVATADKLPIGLMLGLSPSLCEQQHHYDFSGLTTYQALRLSLAETQYMLALVDGVYNITANDLSTTEKQLQMYAFDSFSSAPASMNELATRLTGFIYDVVEGAGSFLGNSLGRPDDEHIIIPVYRNLTTPQIANDIVKRGSKGLWIMQATRNDPKPVPGSAIVSMYDYHDIQDKVPDVTCIQVPTK